MTQWYVVHLLILCSYKNSKKHETPGLSIGMN